MKKWIVVLMMVFALALIGGSEGDNIRVVSGSILTSSGDQGTVWSTPTLGATVTGPTSNAMFIGPGMKITTLYASDKDTEKRYVSIWIIDQDENVPLDKSVLYEKAMVFTDKTPDELRAGIPLLSLLEKHNKVREGLKNKEDKPLKKIRLRDLQVIIRNW